MRAAGVPGLVFERDLGPAIATLRFVGAVPEDVVARAVERLRDPRAALLGPSPEQLGPGEQMP